MSHMKKEGDIKLELRLSNNSSSSSSTSNNLNLRCTAASNSACSSIASPSSAAGVLPRSHTGLSPLGEGRHHHEPLVQLELLPPRPFCHELAPPPPAPHGLAPWQQERQQQQDPELQRRAVTRRIDMNQMPPCVDHIGEEASPSSAMTLCSLAQKRDRGDLISDASPRASDEEADGGSGARKKLRLSKEQSALLEESFKDHPTLNPKQKTALAKQLNLRPRQVEVWFQNRRARTKLKQTEVDCELLKRCCESLAEENRRLQKELHELRSIKMLAPPYSQDMLLPLPAAPTLTMCPSCERVMATVAGGASSKAAYANTAAAAVDGRGVHTLAPRGLHHRPHALALSQPSAAC